MISSHTIICSTHNFKSGLSNGLAGKDRRYDLRSPCNEETLVEMLLSLCERASDGELTHEVLCYEAGEIVGYVMSSAERRWIDEQQQRELG